MKIDGWVKKLINDPARDIRERVFIVLTMSATVVSAIALIGDLIYGSNILEIITLIAAVIAIPVITYVGVKTDRIQVMTRIVAFALIIVIVPVAFLAGGGAEGTVIPWLIFIYLYIGLMLSGWWRVVSLIVHTVIVIGLFFYGFSHPEHVQELPRSTRYIDITLSVIEVGYICFVMTWFQNLMFRHENEMAREETEKVAELNRSQNRFFSSMSHEIRTPINSVLGLNEIILRQPDASEEIKKDALNIQGAGRMLLALINDILDFSKIEAGKMDIVPTNYSIASLISEIVNMIMLRAQDKGLEFNVELDPSIPSELYGDEVRIKQILINLLNNAVKYTREGSVTLHVEKESAEEGYVILIFTIEDTGLGIKQDVIPHLFDAFQRVDEDKNVGIEGTGLGLSIVKQLVDLMGGTITVDSVYTQGSTFTVALKQKVIRGDAVGSIDIKEYDNRSFSGEYKPGFTAPDARILIVDDNEMNLIVESKLLDGTLISVDTAGSGKEALNRTLSEHYDLILMDHLMPEMDGIECLQFIRNQSGGLNNRIPIIVLTANAGSEMKELYLSSGFEDYLVKPVTGRALEETLLAHLPASKIKMSDGAEGASVRLNTSSSYSRKVPVAVTCALTCDIPLSVLKHHQIDTVCYTITSEDMSCYDGLEAKSDELIRYMNNGKSFAAIPPTVDEYISFFGKVLKRAHNVIYISAASGLSPEYERATEAARSYGNVTVIDSETSSAAVGMLALVANRMSVRGGTYEKVVEEIEKAKKTIHASFLCDSMYYANRRGFFDNVIVNFMNTLNVKLAISYNKTIFGVDRVYRGSFDDYITRFMDHILEKAGKEDIDLIVVVHTGMSEEQMDYIRHYLAPRRVIFFLSSSVMPIYMGVGTFGMVCFEKGRYSNELIGMLSVSDKQDDGSYDDADEEEYSPELYAGADGGNETKGKVISLKSLSGIDYETGLKNSGSEDTFKDLLEVYFKSVNNNYDEICGLYDKEDWKNYTIKVHALKSSSLLVGAVELSQECKELEMAGKRDDIDYIRNNHKTAMDHLKSYDEILGAFFAGPSGDETLDDTAGGSTAEETSHESGIAFDSVLIRSVYDTIREAAKENDEETISSTIMEIIEYPVSMEDAEKLEQIQMMLEKGEFGKMASVIDG